MADNAGDVIYSAVIAIKYKLTVADLVNTQGTLPNNS